MSLANRSFKNNKTGDVIKVIDSFENIAILENKQKIDTRTLMDSNQYTEQIDPASFFNNQGAYNILAEKIKNIPYDKLPEDSQELTNRVSVNLENNSLRPSTEESAVVYSSEEDEKVELARKYGASISPADEISRQNEAFAKLLGEEEELPRATVQVNRNIEETNSQFRQPVSVQPTIDPVTQMFKNVKRNVDFSISIDIENKIPRLDFIEMMEDSYEVSIIDFLAEEFTNKILQDPSSIKTKIKQEIENLVYKRGLTPVNPQITDSVTQTHKEDVSLDSQTDLPKKTNRKPRTKKENTKNG
jgi:hypothetical protein